MKKRLLYTMFGMALGAVLTSSTAVIAQTTPPAATATPAADGEAWEVPLPKWGDTKVRDWKEAESGNFADNVQTANLPDTTFMAFAKLDGQAPCSDSANCKGWFGSLNEDGRKAALTRLAAALANSFSSLGFDRSEVTEMGFGGLVEKIGENRALLSVARLQRDVAMHDGTLYGVVGITDGGKGIRAKQRLERKIDKAAEEFEKATEEHGDLVSTANKTCNRMDENGISEAVKKVRQKRCDAALATAEIQEQKAIAAKKNLDQLETELAGGPAPAPNAPTPGGGSAGSSGTVN